MNITPFAFAGYFPAPCRETEGRTFAFLAVGVSLAQTSVAVGQ
jgi:hypothetical protein